MRRAITLFLRFSMRVFYRRIELVGLERVPEGPVIFAVNHPNGLVDPLFLLCFAPREVSFLAKAPLLRYPFIGWIARAFDAIPVYRKQDNTSGSNRETFALARGLLQRGVSIAIFPEGTTHDDPYLRELKTGVARIALGANLPECAVVPTGIYYTAKHVFRSKALVMFGEPLTVAPATVDEEGEPPRGAVEALTNMIDEGLDRITLQADSHAALDLIARAEDIFTADERQPLAEELDLRRRFIDGYHYLRAHDPQRLQRLQQAIAQFEAELRRAKIEVHELVPRIDALRLFRVLVLLPLALTGAAVHYPAYRLIGVLARRFSKGENALVATMKFLGAFALYPITWIIVALLLGWPWGIVALLVLPPLAWLALRVFEDIDDMIGDLRALRHRADLEALRKRRSQLRHEIAAVAEELTRDDVPLGAPPR
jgi:glycerol-3-phosphate O-acyltransferase / dihydroxyacetone phosphate acyltransferase